MTQASNDVFALAETRLSWIERRQGVLAQNIANANTPGYISHDVKPFSEMLEAAAKRAPGAAPVDRGVPETSIDGNGVSLDQQMEKVAETDTAHQLAMNLYKKYIGLFRSAIGRA
jgi:flagellar basal-body rod protein FlgB